MLISALNSLGNSLTVFLVQSPKLQVTIALPGVVQLVAIRELGDERAGILGERVEEDAVDGDGEELESALAQQQHECY